jgi:osmotically-inducible protein OsmY
MSNKSHLARLLVILLPILFLLAGAVAPLGAYSDNSTISSAVNSQGPCPTGDATDEKIVKVIQGKIVADTRFKEQRRHINVSSKDGVVRLEGWVKGRAQVTALVGLARNTECVKSVMTSLPQRNGPPIVLLKSSRQSGSCGANQQDCCDGCILKTSRCNCLD